MAPPPVLHLLTGPTAVGKTEWALRWAERCSAEIVSCDSLQVYRGLDAAAQDVQSAIDASREPFHPPAWDSCSTPGC